MFKKTLVAALLACGVSVAFAGGMGNNMSPWFVDGAFAFTAANSLPTAVTTAGAANSTNFTNNGAGAAFGFGYEGRLAHRVIAGMRVGYAWLGSYNFRVTANNDYFKQTLNGFDGSLFLGYRLSNNTTIRGYAGVAYVRVKSDDVDASAPAADVHSSSWDNVPMFGAGLTYRFSRMVSGILNWTHYAGDDMSGTPASSAMYGKVPTLDSFQIGVRVNV